MGDFTTLMARDGHEFQAYLAAAQGKPRGAVVVIQEIFGVNPHIRSLVDRYASYGYRAIAPAVFDRVERGVELDYDADGIAKGRDLAGRIKWDPVMADVAAAVAHVAATGPVGIVGFCFGGSVAWLAASTLPVTAAVGYYGGQLLVIGWLRDQPEPLLPLARQVAGSPSLVEGVW